MYSNAALKLSCANPKKKIKIKYTLQENYSLLTKRHKKECLFIDTSTPTLNHNILPGTFTLHKDGAVIGF